jgi:hypothetical protein
MRLAAAELGEGGQSIGNTFNQSQPCRSTRQGGEERLQDGRCCLVAPIAKKGGQPDAEHRAVKPTGGRRRRLIGRGGHRAESENRGVP